MEYQLKQGCLVKLREKGMSFLHTHPPQLFLLAENHHQDDPRSSGKKLFPSDCGAENSPTSDSPGLWSGIPALNFKWVKNKLLLYEHVDIPKCIFPSHLYYFNLPICLLSSDSVISYEYFTFCIQIICLWICASQKAVRSWQKGWCLRLVWKYPLINKE